MAELRHRQKRSWHHQHALCFAMKIIEEIIAAGLLRPHANHGLLANGHDLLEMQIAALEFRGDGVEIGNVNFERPSGRRMQLGGFEFAVLDGQRQRNGILGPCAARSERCRRTVVKARR